MYGLVVWTTYSSLHESQKCIGYKFHQHALVLSLFLRSLPCLKNELAYCISSSIIHLCTIPHLPHKYQKRNPGYLNFVIRLVLLNKLHLTESDILSKISIPCLHLTKYFQSKYPVPNRHAFHDKHPGPNRQSLSEITLT